MSIITSTHGQLVINGKAVRDRDAMLASIAPEFSPSTAYEAGRYVIHSGENSSPEIRKFTSNHAAGTWTESDNEVATIDDILDDLTRSITGKDVEVPAGTKLEGMPDLVDSIPLRLPTINDNYYRIDWINSTGGNSTNEIRVNFDPDVDLEYFGVIRIPSLSGNYPNIFVSNGSNSSAQFRISGNTSINCTNRNNYSVSHTIPSIVNRKVSFSLVNNTVTIDSSTFTDVPFDPTEKVTSIRPLYSVNRNLFLYSFGLRKNGVVLYNYIPVMAKLTGEVYLYDTINDTYYGDTYWFGGLD